MPKTTGEEELERLARGSFLKPWTFPNLFYKQGKELADLIVRYDDAVVIFSEKGKNFKTTVEPINGWLQWKSVIDHSIKQIKGAERQILLQNPILYLDARCHNPAPRHLFEVTANRIFRIAVVRGSGLATQLFCRSNTGSLMISSHRNGAPPDIPFAYNPHDGSGKIFHVLDDYTFRALFKHIDTAPDLLNYLEKKELLLKSIDTFECHGEEELIQHYLRNVDRDGEHGFEKIIDHAIEREASRILFAEDSFADFEIQDELVTKKADDLPSYVVDKFIDHMFETYIDEHPEAAPRAEQGLRQLASLSRVERRMLGAHMLEVAQMHPSESIFSRTLFSGNSIDKANSATLILLIEIRTDFHPEPVSSSEIDAFANAIAKCYVAKTASKAPSVNHFSIIIFLRDLRGSPVLHSQAVAYIPKADITEDFMTQYAFLADELKVGRFDGPIHNYSEKEYRGNDEASAPRER